MLIVNGGRCNLENLESPGFSLGALFLLGVMKSQFFTGGILVFNNGILLVLFEWYHHKLYTLSDAHH